MDAAQAAKLDGLLAEHGGDSFSAEQVRAIVADVVSAGQLSRLDELVSVCERLEGMAVQSATNASKQAGAQQQQAERLEGMTMQAASNLAKFEKKLDSRTEGLEGMLMAAAMTGSRMQKMLDDRTQVMETMLVASADSHRKQTELMQGIAPSPDVPRLTWGGDLGGWSGSEDEDWPEAGEEKDEELEPRRPATSTDALVAKVEEVVAKAPGGEGGPPILIGIAGVPGSGKSTITAELAAALDGREGVGAVASMGMDGFHLPRSALDAMADPSTAHARRGAPFTFDAEGFASCLANVRQQLAQGNSVSVPTFDHEEGDPKADGLTIDGATRVVLVEGNYLLLGRLGQAMGDPEWKAWEGLLPSFDALWFLACGVDTACERVARRNMRNPGWESLSLEEARERVDQNDRVNAMLVAQCAAHADFAFEVAASTEAAAAQAASAEGAEARPEGEAKRSRSPRSSRIEKTSSMGEDDGTTQMLQFQASKIVALTQEKHELEEELRRLGSTRKRNATTGLTERMVQGDGTAGGEVAEGQPPPSPGP